MIDVLFLPSQLDPDALPRSQVVILDVLRATSTIVTALANAAREVRLFGDIDSAIAARKLLTGPALLAGERGCVKVEGFDAGNSPAEFETHRVGNTTVCLTTTNGTVAALAAQNAHALYAGSLLNATATAQALMPNLNALDTLLLCAGTNGRIACEDVIGAGAILWQLLQHTYRPDLPFTDTAWIAYQTFAAARQRLPAALRLGQGGINLIDNGLEDDIDLCAALDTKPIVAQIHRHPLRVLRAE